MDFIIVPIIETSYHVPNSGTKGLLRLIMGYKWIILLSSIIIGMSIIFSDGIYYFESTQIGTVQKYNKFTGHMEFCHLVEKKAKCQGLNNEYLFRVNPASTPISVEDFLKDPENFTVKLSPLKLFRNKYYDAIDISDEKLVLSLYELYKRETGVVLSLEEFQAFVGYLPDGFESIKDDEND